MKKIYPHSLIASIQNVDLTNYLCLLLKSSKCEGEWGNKQMQNITICYKVLGRKSLFWRT